MEFIATFSFNKTAAREDVQLDCINFRLGGKPFTLSLAGLAITLGLYTHAQIENPTFDEFIASCKCGQDENSNQTNIWAVIGRWPFVNSSTKANNLKVNESQAMTI